MLRLKVTEEERACGMPDYFAGRLEGMEAGSEVLPEDVMKAFFDLTEDEVSVFAVEFVADMLNELNEELEPEMERGTCGICRDSGLVHFTTGNCRNCEDAIRPVSV